MTNPINQIVDSVLVQAFVLFNEFTYLLTSDNGYPEMHVEAKLKCTNIFCFARIALCLKSLLFVYIAGGLDVREII